MQGLQIFDGNGNVTLDVTSSLTRVIGSFHTGITDGSIVNSEITNGIPWFTIVLNGSATQGKFQSLMVTIDGSTLSWNFQKSSNLTNAPVYIEYIITYGVS